MLHGGGRWPDAGKPCDRLLHHANSRMPEMHDRRGTDVPRCPCSEWHLRNSIQEPWVTLLDQLRSPRCSPTQLASQILAQTRVWVLQAIEISKLQPDHATAGLRHQAPPLGVPSAMVMQLRRLETRFT